MKRPHEPAPEVIEAIAQFLFDSRVFLPPNTTLGHVAEGLYRVIKEAENAAKIRS